MYLAYCSNSLAVPGNVTEFARRVKENAQKWSQSSHVTTVTCHSGLLLLLRVWLPPSKPVLGHLLVTRRPSCVRPDMQRCCCMVHIHSHSIQGFFKRLLGNIAQSSV